MNNYILPAEFDKHEATWIGWPHNKSDWPGKFSAIPFVYAEIVKQISRSETVRVIIESKEHQKKAEKVLKDADVDFSNIKFFIKKTNRGWLRDSAPFFVKSKNDLTAVDFKFNAWAKYDDYKLDDTIPRFISNKLNLKKVTAQHYEKSVVLEGGAPALLM